MPKITSAELDWALETPKDSSLSNHPSQLKRVLLSQINFGKYYSLQWTTSSPLQRTHLQRPLLRMSPTGGDETSRGRNPENGRRRDFGRRRRHRQSGFQHTDRPRPSSPEFFNKDLRRCLPRLRASAEERKVRALLRPLPSSMIKHRWWAKPSIFPNNEWAKWWHEMN